LIPPKFRSRIVVIGAGLGGLAAAIRLRLAGCEVHVIERNDQVGGKMGDLEWNGYRWDTGPSLLTMPHVLADLWGRAGAKLEEDLELTRLPATCRYRWEDGTLADEDEAFWARPDVAAFLRHGRGLYEISAETFLHRPLDEWTRQLAPGKLHLLRHLPKIIDPRPLAALTARFFPDSPHLQQLFNRFATYNGSSPYLTPAAFAIIPYVQARFGGWYVAGGLHRIAEGLARLARGLGVTIETGVQADRLQRNGDGWTVFTRERDRDGGPARPLRGDGVVCNQDALEATRRLLDPGFRPAHPLSSSGFVVYAAVARQTPELAHHNLFFSGDYRREFEEIFGRGEPAGEPTVYVAVSAKSDPTRAPDGCENWFVLVNAPAAKPKFDWAARAPEYAARILGRLERFGVPDPLPFVRRLQTFTPEDFAARDLAAGGALYGYASHGPRAAFLRPPMVARLPRLVFCGGATHPGGGVPLVLLSGQMAAAKLLQQMGGKKIELPPAARA
jgi:phytoene desaturase